MIKIILKNGARAFWKANEFDSYEYDGKALCIYKLHRLVGMYNIDNIISMIFKEEGEAITN